MNAVFTPDQREKLAKVLSLLASDKAGERDAAVLAAGRMLERHGLRWPDLIGLATPGSSKTQEKPKRAAPGWRDVCARIMRRQGGLNEWERQFVSGLPKFPALSAKQRAILEQIAQRVLGADFK